MGPNPPNLAASRPRERFASADRPLSEGDHPEDSRPIHAGSTHGAEPSTIFGGSGPPGARGEVYSTTTVHSRDGAYNVCLVDLEDGVRMMSTVVGIAPEDVRIGMAVLAREDEDGRIVFERGPDA